MIVAQILTKFDQILIMYVKNHEIHVKKFEERHFLQIKIIQRQKSSRIWGIGVLGGGIGVLGGGIN